MLIVVIIPASASTLIPIPPEEIGNRQGVNENSPPRGEIKVRQIIPDYQR